MICGSEARHFNHWALMIYKQIDSHKYYKTFKLPFFDVVSKKYSSWCSEIPQRANLGFNKINISKLDEIYIPFN